MPGVPVGAGAAVEFVLAADAMEDIADEADDAADEVSVAVREVVVDVPLPPFCRGRTASGEAIAAPAALRRRSFENMVV